MSHSDKNKIPEGQTCGLCTNPATCYCPFCMDEYDYGKEPSSFYCNDHYIRVVETGNCCYGSEQVYGMVDGRYRNG